VPYLSSVAANPLALCFALSSVAALLIVLTQRWHGRYSYDSLDGVQKVHHERVPRIGGLAIFVAIIAAYLVVPPDAKAVLQPTLVLGAVAFSFGFMEDISKRVSVAIRLWATMLPGIIGYGLTGMALGPLGIPGIDAALQWTPLAVVFTAFAVCGVTQAINMIDGYNGLAGWTCIWILLGIALLALSANDLATAIAALIVLAATAGFLVVNWPWGKLFLGDGGTYLLGASIAWLCVSLVSRNPGISPFACLVLCSYPIIEVLYSMARRAKSGVSSGRPDRLHLHQIIAAAFVYPATTRLRPVYQNSVTGLAISLFSLLALVIALSFARSQGTLIIAFGLLAAGYVALYTLCKRRVDRRGHESKASTAAVFVKPKPSAPLSTGRE